MVSQINLAPQDQLTASFLGKFLTWALTIGRYIVVFTELIVILAFLSRFFLDNQHRSLSATIEQKAAIVAASADFETNFRRTQNRLAVTSTLAASQLPTQSFLQDIENLLPQTVYLTQIGIKDNTISLKGVALSDTSLTQLLQNLKSHPRLTKVSLGQLTIQAGQSTPGIEFNLTATWLPQPTKTQ